METSKKDHLAVCKAALESLQAEIKEAKDKLMARESRLENAIQEGKPEFILASFKSLYEGASANLAGLQKKVKELLKREMTLLLALSTSTSDDEMEEISRPTSAKRRKVDDLIEKSKKYLFRTDRWGCVGLRHRHQEKKSCIICP